MAVSVVLYSKLDSSSKLELMAVMSQPIVLSFKLKEAGRRADFVVHCFCLPPEFAIIEVGFGEMVGYFYLHVASFDFLDSAEFPFIKFLLI